jgi:NADH-quinone oxidoreductase subunit G
MPRVRISPAPCRIATRAASSSAPARIARELLAAPQKAYLLFGGTEPWAGLAADAQRGAGRAPIRRRRHAVCRRDAEVVAHVLLPISTFAETSGTYVNLEGLWQSFAGAPSRWAKRARLEGAARARQPRRRRDFDYQSPKKCARNCARVARRSPRIPTRAPAIEVRPRR